MQTNFSKLALGLILLCGFGGTALADGEDEPIPSFYEEPGLSRTRDYVNQHANERVDPFTGKLQWHYVDLFIPGNGGLDLKVQRSYTSPHVPGLGTPWEPTVTGLGWTMHFGRVIRRAVNAICDTVSGPTTNPVLELPDGSRRVLYVALDGGTWITTDFWRAECAPAGAGLIVFSPDGTRYEMTTPGHPVGSPTHVQNTYYVTRITERNGNFMDVTYAQVDGVLAVTGVTTSDARAVSFTHNHSQEGELESMTVSDGARTWTYLYSPGPLAAYPYLKEVVRPDGTRWRYEYNETPAGPGDYALRQVTYPQGGTIDYTYDYVFFATHPSIPRSTVVAQKVADPGGTWSWTYVPATQPIASNPDGTFNMQIPPTPEQEPTVDKTSVAGPEGTRTHYHVGYNSAYPGIVYLIGFQLGTASSVQNLAFGATPIQISNQPNQRPGDELIFEAVTAAPLITFQAMGRFDELFQTVFGNFDLFGNPQTITETGTNTRTTNLTYFVDAAKWIIRGVKKDEIVTENTPGGQETLAITRTFDASANLLSETRAGVTTTFTYHATGDLATRTDARLKTTSYLNYHRGIPQTENQPEAVTLTRVVSDAGNITSETDGENATTTYSYDGLNRVTGITHPLGNPVAVDWTATTRTVTRGPYREVITYDGFGREVSVQHTDTASAESVTQTYAVDAIGRRVFTAYPNAALGTRFDYDLLNRLSDVFHQFNPATSAFEGQRLYDYFSNKVRVVNERGFEYFFNYRSYGDPERRDLVGITTPPGVAEASLAIGRNIAGQMTSVTQDEVTRSYGYDTRFYLTSITDPETGTTVMGRDEVGNMTSRQVGTAEATTYAYDDRNRLSAITYPAGTPAVTKTYYKDDKPGTVGSTAALWEYFYDANKNLTREKLTVGAKVFETQYAYNGNDALTTLTYGSGRTVGYAPDAFGRPRQVAPYVTAVAYHPTGQPSSVTYANGVETAIGLNPRQWPSTLQITKGTALFDTIYGYDPLGNVTSIADTVDSAYNRTLAYDPLDRLTGVSGPWGAGAIGYDFRGNITSQSLGAFGLTYAYDSMTQRLLSVSGSKSYTLSYDVYGNVTGNGATTFGYDDASNLRCAQCGGAGEILFDYDGTNQRVRLQKGGAETFFVYGHGGLLLWEETPGASLKEYVYLGGKQVATREQPLP
jgi:YD repeat-containing protein